ncbi:MAG: phosphotransferase system HPr (HPr) family protein [Dactylosporangium sp.]|jgi:phosphocarrier protein|nr:phosphotransferase system HPr (HPr) family protein [Dactylosporangium sp.]
MPERRVTVGSKVGLHARPASLFVQEVVKHTVPVTIRRVDGQPVDARSILSVLSLNVRGGDEVLLATNDDDSGHVLDQLADVLARDLDEEH